MVRVASNTEYSVLHLQLRLSTPPLTYQGKITYIDTEYGLGTKALRHRDLAK